MELGLEAGLERGFRIVHLVGEGELRLLHGKLVLQRILGFRSAALHRLLLLSPLFREVNFQQPRPRYQPEDPSSYRSPRPVFQTQYRTDFQSHQSSACFEWTGCPSKWRYSRECTTALRHLAAEGLHNLESFGQCGDSASLHLPPRSGSRGTG